MFMNDNRSLLTFVVCCLLLCLCQNQFVSGWPDAIRCGADLGCCAGAIYFKHSASATSSYFCQVYNVEERCVIFNSDGSYNSGRGHYQSRQGCENQSIAQLKAQGRSFILSNQNLVTRIADVEEKVKTCTCGFTQTKEQLFAEFQTRILAGIKTNGLQIGTACTP